MKNALGPTGLSMSQAQSASNLCNQRATEISRLLNSVNNATVAFKYQGEDYVTQTGYEMPDNAAELILTKGHLHALQAFLMENIKAKDALIDQLKAKEYKHPTAYTPVESVTEKWGWDQLKISEVNDYLALESQAAHIGQFIHNGGKLDALRKELPTIAPTYWSRVDSNTTIPYKVSVHHKAEDLMKLHEKLALLHRSAERKVNYYKAKVKNLVTLRNAEISDENSATFQAFAPSYALAKESFEKQRLLDIKDASALRITIPADFKPLLDELLGVTGEKE